MTKISGLSPAGDLSGTELIPVVQAGQTKKATVSDFFKFSEIGATLERLAESDAAGLIGYASDETFLGGTVGAKLKERLSVKDAPFNAKGDGVTNDAPAFQAAINAAIAQGRELYVPAGRYVINSPLTATLANPNIGAGGRFSIRGEGSGQTVLLFNGTGQLLTVSAPAWFQPGTYANLYVGGITFNGQNYIRNGLKIERVIGYYLEDCEFLQFDLAHHIVDVVAGRYSSCKFQFNFRGTLGEPGPNLFGSNEGSPPNILTFVGCTFANNRRYGAWFKYSAPVVFVGGSFEGNGRSGSWAAIPKADRWDLRISDGGFNGVNALSMFGTHTESSGGRAVVIIDHTNYPTSYLFSGVDFIPNGFDFGFGPEFPNHCILFNTTGASKATVVVQGGGFTGVNGYVASASRRVVAEGTVSGNNHKFMFSGPVFWSDVDAPASTLPRVEFERGSNSNGEFIRYPDGTQICTARLTIVSGGNVTWTYPAAFAAGTEPSLSGVPITGGVAAYVTTGSNFATAGTLFGWNGTGASANFPLYATAVGRWF